MTISVKWRTSSDPTTSKLRKLQGKLRTCYKHEKSEVPDIIEGVPVCSGNPSNQTHKHSDTDSGRVVFQMPVDEDRQSR